MTEVFKVRGFRSRPINALVDRVREDTPVAGRGVDVMRSGPAGSVVSLAAGADGRVPFPFEVRWTREPSGATDPASPQFEWKLAVFLGRVTAGGEECELRREDGEEGSGEEGGGEPPADARSGLEILTIGAAGTGWNELCVVVDCPNREWRVSNIRQGAGLGDGVVQVAIARYNRDGFLLEQVHMGDVAVKEAVAFASWITLTRNSSAPIAEAANDQGKVVFPVSNQFTSWPEGEHLLALCVETVETGGWDD